MKNPVFANLSAGGKLVLLLGLVIVFGVLVSLFGLLIGKWYLGVSLAQLAVLISDPEGKALTFTLFFQFISQLGVFILPALFYGFFVSSKPGRFLHIGQAPSAVSLLIVTLVVYAILPFVNYLQDINQSLHITTGIDYWIRTKEAQAQKLTEAFLKTESFGGLSVNLLVMALMPALGEELIFRGVVQGLFVKMTRNTHLGIIITAFIFSAIHMQFLGFLPRFVLGIMLGYAFVISGSLWTPIWLHFVNNASSVVIYYLHFNGLIKVSMDNFGNTQNMVYIIGSLLVTIWFFIMMYNKEGAAIKFKYHD